MKRFLTGVLLCATLPVLAQQEETLLKGKIESGGFGAPVVKFTEIKDEFSVLVGGRGGWILNHTFAIGGGAYGLVTENIEQGRAVTGNPIYLTMGYGGLELEYIMNSDKLVHLNMLVLIGGGGVGQREKGGGYREDFNGDVFFVFEPALNVELNVTTFFRICLGGSFRLISGTDFHDIQNGDLAGPAGAVTLKFGKF